MDRYTGTKWREEVGWVGGWVVEGRPEESKNLEEDGGPSSPVKCFNVPEKEFYKWPKFSISFSFFCSPPHPSLQITKKPWVV